MNDTGNVQRVTFKIIVFVLVFIVCSCLLFTGAFAKIYIDITSPAVRKLPIAIFDFQGPSGKEIAEIIRDDLIFTGLFMYIDKSSYIESASQPFNPLNWTPLGIEAVIKGTVQKDQGISVDVFLYDTFQASEILHKRYNAESALLRQLAHGIANDVYQALTGKPGIFRSKIAFVGEDGNSKGIYIMDWDGERIKKFGLKGSMVLAPHWSKDGKQIVYSAERNRKWGVYLINFLRMTEKKIYSAKGTNIAGDFFPDGNAFVLSSSQRGTPDLFTYDILRKKLRRITSSSGIEVSPTVSPDGAHIAFVSDRGGSPQIYVMDRNGSDIRRITFEGSYNTSPNWSPKGDRIAFSGRSGGKNQIFTLQPDGTDLTQLTQYGNNEEPSFSPDGRYITFSSDRRGRKGIYIMRANGEAQKRISPKWLKAYGPRWSPQ